MPLSQEQIDSFTKRAKALGATDSQILSEIARKQQEVTKLERVNSAAEAGILSPEKAFEAGADVSTISAGKKQSAQAAKQPLVDSLQRLLERDTAPITGLLQIRSNIPGTKATTTKNMFDQIQGQLSLDNREKLKGSGAISDFEARLLQNAASSLGRNQSDEEFRKTITDLLNGLQSSSPSTTAKVKMTAPDGNQYEVDQSEAAEAEKNGWKRI